MVTGHLDDTRNQKSQTEALSDRTKAVRNRVDSLVAKSNEPNARRAIEAALSQIADIESRLATGSVAPAEMANFVSVLSSVLTLASTVESESGRANEHLVHGALELAHAEARRSIQSVADDLFGHKVLDRYLRFSSPEDEAAYRQREAENAKAVEKELAKGTPAGSLKAATLTKAQLEDAEAHGADASPDLEKMKARTEGAIETLRIVVARTEEKAEAVAPHGASPAEASAPAASAGELASVMAQLKAAGVTTLEPANSAAHGLAADARGPKASIGKL